MAPVARLHRDHAQPRSGDCRYEPVPICPVCSQQLQTLDLPCPSCSTDSFDVGNQESDVREFSGTLHYARVIRYRPQEFVDQVNRWLLAHPGIVGISAVLHRDREGVRRITFTCRATLDPIPLRAQIACLSLRTQLGKRIYDDPGQALSTWADANPRARRLNHWIFAASGNASEVWVLYVVPASAVEDPGEGVAPIAGRPRRQYLATGLRTVIALLVLLTAFLALGFIVIVLDPNSPSRGSNLTTLAAVILVMFTVIFGLGRFRRSPFSRHKRSPTL
jgi:hypothetical protein